MVGIDDVKIMLYRNGYHVLVGLDPEQNIFAVFPKRVEEPATEEFSLRFINDKSNKRVVISTIHEDEVIGSAAIDCPSYAYKAMALAKIGAICRKMHYYFRLLRYFHLDKEVDLDTFVAIKMDELPVEEEALALPMTAITLLAIQEGYNEEYERVAKLNGCLEGYLAIKEMVGCQ
jgi:hypothetical protein